MNSEEQDPRNGTPFAGPGIGRRRLVAGTAGVVAAGAVLAELGTVPAAAASRGASGRGRGRDPRTPVRTTSGLVTGADAALAGVSVYKGIPYAASTAGRNRWRAPQPAPSWKGVRAADSWGPACPQPVTGIPADQVPELSEDCLNLNIWTGATSSKERRPVIVWIYGGRDSAMWASQPIYDGSGLADKGAVVVTFNHRVGPFGGLALPELNAETGHGSGNWGTQDTVACLKWIRNNIAAFGGDPERVTLAGWSHGSSFVNILMISKLARGLFHRGALWAGVQYTKDPSLGHVAGGYSPLADCEAVGTAYEKYLGVSSLAGLRAISAAELVEKTFAADAPAEATDFGNVLDGYVLPTTYTGAMTSRTETDIPVFTGNNKDENGASPTLTMTVAAYREFAAETFGDKAPAFLRLYPASTDTEAAAQYNAYCRDEERVSTFLWGTQFKSVARNRSSVFIYWFTQAPPGTDTTSPIVGTGTVGAYHGAEINYMFGNLYGTDRPWTSSDHKVADKASSYLVNFAAHGDPNGRGLPAWPALRTSRAVTLELGAPTKTIDSADSPAKFAFLKAYLESQTTAF
ncbi:carboxylesterase/lipase family protein [Streptomyces sp. NPDC090306]|uniref:carboxylesterase/lipase family protein n=1 Tax=Streptomyces sp. NPDC090306 TaxID=3365961 RepID=UPI00381F747E